MGSAREIVCRNFKKREKLFLNYESQKNVSLGDIFLWNGRKAEFNIVTRLEILGITPYIHESTVKSTQLFNSESGVQTLFELLGKTGQPTMGFKYKGSSRYSLQAFDTVVESLDEVKLATDITQAQKANPFVWDKEWIVVTTVWNAGAYTQLVAGGRSAEAGVCANSGAVSNAFNIADISVGVSLGYGSNLSSYQVAGRGARPFFIGMKYRKQKHKISHMVRYSS